MPYHSLALAKSRSEVEANTQTLILALMRVAGGGFILTELRSQSCCVFPFKQEKPGHDTVFSLFASAHL